MGKRVQRGDHGKLIPVNMGGGGKGVIEYYRALWKDQVSFKLRKHLIQGSGGGGSEDFGLSHSFHGEREGITFWQKNTKGSSCSFSRQLLVFELRSLSTNKQSSS